MLYTSSLLVSNQNRKRHRHIGFVISRPDRFFSRADVKKAIVVYGKKFFGNRFRDVGLRLTRFNGREGMIHCYHLYKEDVISMLKSIKKIEQYNVEIVTVGTSGTIKSLNKKFFGGRLKKEHDPDYMSRKKRSIGKST